MKRKKRDHNKEHEKDSTPPSMLDSLHLDLKLDILSCLPAKSLTKLRCVSKMWSSIIRSQGFIDSFFAMSSTKPRFIVALTNGFILPPEERLTFFYSFSHEGEESSSLVPNFEMVTPTSLCYCSEYFASLHGFLTVETNKGLMLCNPGTEQVITLPKAATFVGYDPIGDQYKALAVEVSVRKPAAHKVLTLGGAQGWRDIEGPPGPYRTTTSVGICINGVIYSGAHEYSTQSNNPVIVCFDVRSEKMSFIQAPDDVVHWGCKSILIDYNGKLASIARDPRCDLRRFDLWILEDVEKPIWSKHACVLPSSMWAPIGVVEYSFPGATKAGEIIIHPNGLAREVEPFYIFYFNVKTQNVRRVRLLGIGDNQEFRRSYGFEDTCECFVRMVPQNVESIAFLKNHT
ncbi:unnamed protein product [Thlaspi arvense]|uniref:F-box domain-containing protein n=1 Tax=Thlaspi arvense TaxID=13288 RepID=A0AAU9R6N3_THLAR|nr:unnamed protein product [Thlaspi arvense]